MGKKYRLLILDFDGTIGDTNSIITSTMQATLSEMGLPARSRQECSTTIGLPLRDCFKALIPMGDETAERCAEIYTRIFMESHKPGVVPVYPHVIDTIRQLHDAGIIITLASSRGHESLEAFVKEFQLNDYISLILGADDVKHAKPEPDPVLQTIEFINKQLKTWNDVHPIKKAETLVVGDMSYDILMGRNAGCMTCGVTYGNGTRKELEDAEADYIIDDFAEIMTL